MDTVGVGVRDSQILHLRPRAAHGRRDAKGRQGVAGLGLEYWEAEAEDWLAAYEYRILRDVLAKKLRGCLGMLYVVVS